MDGLMNALTHRHAQTDRWTQPENRMPPSPVVGEGIKLLEVG